MDLKAQERELVARLAVVRSAIRAERLELEGEVAEAPSNHRVGWRPPTGYYGQPAQFNHGTTTGYTIRGRPEPKQRWMRTL